MYGLQDPTGHVQHAAIGDINLLMPAEYIFSVLLDAKAVESHGSIKMTPLLCKI